MVAKNNSYKDEELAARIHGYLIRLSGAYPLPKYNLNKVARWKIQWASNYGTSVVYGRFVDAIAFAVCDYRYFDHWIDNKVEQVSNCNNARIVLAEKTEIYNLPKTKDNVIKMSKSKNLDKLINYI